MRKMAREMDVDEKTMRNFVKKIVASQNANLPASHGSPKRKKIDPSEDSSQETERWYGHL